MEAQLSAILDEAVFGQVMPLRIAQRPEGRVDLAQVRFGLDKPESIQLSVFNAMGVLVQSQNLGDLASGEHTVSLESGNLPAGSYRVVLQGKEGVTNVQWMVVK